MVVTKGGYQGIHLLFLNEIQFAGHVPKKY